MPHATLVGKVVVQAHSRVVILVVCRALLPGELPYHRSVDSNPERGGERREGLALVVVRLVKHHVLDGLAVRVDGPLLVIHRGPLLILILIVPIAVAVAGRSSTAARAAVVGAGAVAARNL